MGLKISRYIRKSVISKFVITVQFCKALLGILLGSKKTSLYLRLRYIRVCTKGVLLYTVPVSVCLQVKWMMYWIVFALFSAVETFTDVLLSW